MEPRRGIAPALAALLLSGCVSQGEPAWQPAHASTETAPQPATSRLQTSIRQAEAAWARRDEQTQVELAIQKWRQAVDIDPRNDETWTALSQAYFFLAHCHLRFEPARKTAMMSAYEKSTETAEHALSALSPQLAERMKRGGHLEDEVGALGRDAVPGLYWRTIALAAWADQKGTGALLAYAHELRGVMSRVNQLDPTYFHGGPDRFFGWFYARMPEFAGGDLGRSKESFERALKEAPDDLATRVAFAADYATKADDGTLYAQQVQHVVHADPDALGGAGPENRCAQREAKQLPPQLSNP